MANPRSSCLWNVKSNFLWAFEFDDHPSSLCCANIKSKPVVASTTNTEMHEKRLVLTVPSEAAYASLLLGYTEIITVLPGQRGDAECNFSLSIFYWFKKKMVQQTWQFRSFSRGCTRQVVSLSSRTEPFITKKCNCINFWNLKREALAHEIIGTAVCMCTLYKFTTMQLSCTEIYVI